MNTSVAIDNQHREEAIEQAHAPISETKAIRSTSTKEKPNYELLAAQLDEIKADTMANLWLSTISKPYLYNFSKQNNL